jgi:hypothetical protein
VFLFEFRQDRNLGEQPWIPLLDHIDLVSQRNRRRHPGFRGVYGGDVLVESVSQLIRMIAKRPDVVADGVDCRDPAIDGGAPITDVQ